MTTFDEVVESLETIARLAKYSSDTQKLADAIKSARNSIKKIKPGSSGARAEALDQLETELSTWQSKLDVILGEPVGRQGMEKHARHWTDKLKGI